MFPKRLEIWVVLSPKRDCGSKTLKVIVGIPTPMLYNERYGSSGPTIVPAARYGAGGTALAQVGLNTASVSVCGQ